MSNRYWTENPQRSVSAKGHGPAYDADGGKVLNDTETKPPYNENIGPDGPDLNRVGFPTVKAHTKARFFKMEGGTPLKTNKEMYNEGSVIGGAIGEAVGSVFDEKPSELKVYEPSGRNAGSAPAETQFSPRVKRYSR